MFLKRTQRIKDGKTHHYWSVVENRRLINGKVMQRQVLYLGEINDGQQLAWRKSIEAFDEGTRRQVALFAEDALPDDDARAIGVRLSELQLKRPRQWGACWLSCVLWQQLGMDEFWSARLPASRKGTCWRQVLQTLVAYRLIDPGSEWRLHRHWFTSSAMADLLDADFALAGKDTLYRCLDKLLPHKDALMLFLKQRWGELFGASFDVLLYDLTSTYFESDTPREEPDKRQYGYSRDKRGDCRQVVIGLIVTPEGFPLSYEVLPGNAADCTTLSDLLRRIEARYGKADRTWVMDRGIPTEETYCLQVTLKNQLRRAAPGLTPRAVLEKFKTMQMVDVHLPTTDGRELILSRYTQPEPEHRLLLDHLRLTLPKQPPPKITARPSPVPANKTFAL
ncbi:IS1634 family transposase [Paraburkholderia hospita]|uniref:IS1634 family transposase n=1 Tax=Paraburkholderia hospita TaxID=169430 RepID=UPI000271827C|nr:IS1634 family transposase [Paraburkholderia hospita]EUC14716.1 transposase IS4 family protein [Burkholderia sp. BT03]SKC94030.1 Transposase DDE domain-containing protein [Paraburkholderia hospita]